MSSLIPATDPRAIDDSDVLRNEIFSKSSGDLFKNLSQIVPTHALVEHSEPYINEWWRFF
ncbi:hypothetical protein FRC11_002010 [Ceratobasidium sp. 423]|nr:hypothetical protein FRC11_002010 [Ceratobasidium sp. 423]